MEEKRPRARHRFDFSGKTRNRDAQTTTDQILNSLNRQAQATLDVSEDQENLVGEHAQIVELDQLAEYPGGRRLGRWLFVGILLASVVFLWAFGLFPRILYVETVGSIDNLISMIPSGDIVIIVTIWVAAMVIGLLGRRARHVSKRRIG
ncbi:hypothetical protein AUI46_03455 [archaeon 13_1_40CM_2_52_13]|nr:MAG: hypothetical protein AUI46_03455 [archaeon 13_1_40CM_2_52_13]OLE69260.1 MAG: hypothetical protein AUF78_12050 [archaeon 13_1_20CM_2_51_12]TMI41261.1 MAG: hypothetical protein E6H21_03090 [Candidatus Bathyarchaeota archaeon]